MLYLLADANMPFTFSNGQVRQGYLNGLVNGQYLVTYKGTQSQYLDSFGRSTHASDPVSVEMLAYEFEPIFNSAPPVVTGQVIQSAVGNAIELTRGSCDECKLEDQDMLGYQIVLNGGRILRYCQGHFDELRKMLEAFSLYRAVTD